MVPDGPREPLPRDPWSVVKQLTVMVIIANDRRDKRPDRGRSSREKGRKRGEKGRKREEGGLVVEGGRKRSGLSGCGAEAEEAAATMLQEEEDEEEKEEEEEEEEREGRSSEDYTTGHFGHFYERDAQERVFY